jgi:hypothetical protein
MSAVKMCFVVCVMLALAGCSEPDKQITRSTGDGEFAVILKAEQNWVYADHSLPIQVRVESLAGPVQEDVNLAIEFVANNGRITPSSLFVTLSGPDAEGNGAEQVFTDWITFEADSPLTTDSRGVTSGIGVEHQGEVHALFRDALTTLKIRIAAPPESL